MNPQLGNRVGLDLMSFGPVLMAFVLLAAFSAFCGWRGARPPDFVRGPRLIPWRPLMVASAVGAILALALLAQQTGLTARQG